MLYGNQTISAYSRGNVSVWMAMAFQAGTLNIGGFMACHQFVSHVTGYATLFGHEASRGDFVHATGLLLVPGFFLIGAIIAAQLIDLKIRREEKPRYYLVFGVMLGLLLVVAIGGFNGLFGTFGEPLAQPRDYALLAFLCLICGLQNATITSVSRAVVRTTHLTGLTTDLGIGIVRVLRKRAGDPRVDEESRANAMRAGLIVSFAFGSFSGAFVFSKAGYRGFLLPLAVTAGLFGLMLYLQVLKPGLVSRAERSEGTKNRTAR